MGEPVAVFGDPKDVDGGDEGRLAGDVKWWLGEVMQLPYKPGQNILVGEMQIKHNQWAMDVQWYSFEKAADCLPLCVCCITMIYVLCWQDNDEGAVYNRWGRRTDTVPLNTCYYLQGLTWRGGPHHRKLLTHSDQQRLHDEWASTNV